MLFGLSAATLAAYCITCLLVMVTPGVTVSALVGTTLAQGMRAAFLVEVGASLARLSMIALLAFGLAGLTLFVAHFFDLIKLIGAAYMMWLGYRFIRYPAHLQPTQVTEQANTRFVLRGMFVLWTNPKALLFLGALIPQFLKTNAPVLPQILLFGAIWLTTVTITDTAYILAAGRARDLFKGSAATIMSRSSGVLLMLAGLWLATSQKA